MKPDYFPEKRPEDFLGTGTAMEGIHQMFQRLFADTEAQMQQLMAQISNQIQFEETYDAYNITVFLEGVEQPKDIEARFENGHLHLQRTVQMQSKRDTDNGGMWQSYYQHFARSIPVPGPIDWNSRSITSRAGSWRIRLPKR